MTDPIFLKDYSNTVIVNKVEANILPVLVKYKTVSNDCNIHVHVHISLNQMALNGVLLTEIYHVCAV